MRTLSNAHANRLDLRHIELFGAPGHPGRLQKAGRYATARGGCRRRPVRRVPGISGPAGHLRAVPTARTGPDVRPAGSCRGAAAPAAGRPGGSTRLCSCPCSRRIGSDGGARSGRFPVSERRFVRYAPLQRAIRQMRISVPDERRLHFAECLRPGIVRTRTAPAALTRCPAACQ